MSKELGIKTLKAAVDVRVGITKKYSKYTIIANQVFLEAGIAKHDFKRAVDAFYYNGGWPHPNSKGRLEAFLDNFAGVVKVLDFVGRIDKVEQLLAPHGITIKLKKADKIKDGKLKMSVPDVFDKKPLTIKELVTQAISLCEELQGEICEDADHIKYELKPVAQKELGVADQEYDRIMGAMRIKATGETGMNKIQSKKKVVADSVKNFGIAMDLAAKDKLVKKESK